VTATEALDPRALDARFGRAPGVAFREQFGGPVAILEAAGSTAIVALQGAQVLSWRAPGHSDDVLWLSPGARLGTGKPVRGGIPICWPWFGPHPTDPSKPAHGFVRAAPWRVVGSASAPGRARIILSFDSTIDGGGSHRPRAHAEIEISLGETLSVALSTDNRDATPLALTQALHTYLTVGDIEGIALSGLDGRGYIDQLDRGALKWQSGDVVFRSEVDRIYQASPDTVVVSDRALGRQISVSKSGSAATVVWNPWIEKSQRLGDMGNEGYRRMVCVETANAGGDVVHVQPRSRHRITTEISVRALP
jgi:glucose-6-phosphate 1-epimerase